MSALDPLVWSILLMLVGCSLVVLEIFIPSGGILGFLAGTAIFSAIVLAFYHQGPDVGFGFLALAVLGVPVLVVLAFKYWPHTPLGRRFLLELPTDDEVLPDSPRQRALKALIGKAGSAKTPMLPSGAVAIEGRTIDAVSQGMAIDAGQPVIVVEVKGNRVVVRPADAEDGGEIAADDVLEQPLDALGLDDLDEPLS